MQLIKQNSLMVTRDFMSWAHELATGDLSGRSAFTRLFGEDGLTEQQAQAGVEAFAVGVALFKRAGQIREDVIGAMFGGAGFGVPGFRSVAELGFSDHESVEEFTEDYWLTVDQASDAEVPAKQYLEMALMPFANAIMLPAIQFIEALIRWDRVFRHFEYEEFVDKKGDTYKRQYTKYILSSASRLSGIVLDTDSVTSTMALSSTPFPSYNERGYTSDGDFIILSTAHEGCVPGRLAIDAVNAAQIMCPFQSTPSVELAAEAFSIAADNLEEANRLTRVILSKRNSKAGAGGWEAQDIDMHELRGIAESSRFLADNGVAYVQMKLDGRGRQYQLGPFSQLNPAAVQLLANSPEMSAEKVDKLGITSVKRLVNRLRALLDGDLGALASFYISESYRDSSGEQRTRYVFKPAALAAACVMLANEKREVANVEAAA